jgi:hypothetical protein
LGGANPLLLIRSLKKLTSKLVESLWSSIVICISTCSLPNLIATGFSISFGTGFL